PFADISFVHSKSNAGKKLSSVHQDIILDTEQEFTGQLNFEVDVLFLCVGHGNSIKFLQENIVPSGVKIISLSQDFRLKENSVFEHRHFIYGLPEINREEIKKADNIANPGCFASAIEFGLLPLAKLNLLQDVYTTGITGSTGAGQSMSATSHFSWRENNVQAYKSLTHQHLSEINESLNSITDNSLTASIHFVPWRGNFTRGIFITSQLKCTETLTEMQMAFEN